MRVTAALPTRSLSIVFQQRDECGFMTETHRVSSGVVFMRVCRAGGRDLSQGRVCCREGVPCAMHSPVLNICPLFIPR